MDYGFHAPTVSFPVAGTLMVEPTESEAEGRARSVLRRDDCDPPGDSGGRSTARRTPKDNVLKNAPHTAAAIASDEWTHPYSREQAAFPLPFVRARQFWPSVGRIDNPYGDRNLFCSCPPMMLATGWQYVRPTRSRTDGFSASARAAPNASSSASSPDRELRRPIDASRRRATIGTTPRVVLVRNASSAPNRSASCKHRFAHRNRRRPRRPRTGTRG